MDNVVLWLASLPLGALLLLFGTLMPIALGLLCRKLLTGRALLWAIMIFAVLFTSLWWNAMLAIEWIDSRADLIQTEREVQKSVVTSVEREAVFLKRWAVITRYQVEGAGGARMLEHVEFAPYLQPMLFSFVVGPLQTVIWLLAWKLRRRRIDVAST